MTRKQSPTDAHPVDITVGQHIRQLRILNGISQMDLANEIGISFQQLQKYETAHNRVSVSRLADIAQALDVEPADLLKGNDTSPYKGVLSFAANTNSETLTLVRTFARIKGKDQRKSILNLVKTIAETN